MASITKTKNGKFKATVYVGRDANGKQIRKSITADTEKEAKRKARELEQEIEEGKFINIRNIRLSKWMIEWLNLNKNRLSPSTFLSYKMYVEVHLTPYFGNLKLSQINEIHIQRYINDKLKELSSTTVRKHFLVMREILGILKQKNPALYISPPPVEKFIPHIVTEDELNMILDHFKKSHYKIIILLSAWGGLRRGEIFALKWKDIDFENCTIKIESAVTISEDGYVEKSPKSSNGYRTVILPEELIEMLKEYRKDNFNTKKVFNFSPSTLTHHFSNIMKKLGLDIRFHDIRHYHSNWLYKNGVPDIHAAKRMGHDIQTLKRIYQHLDVDSHVELDKTIAVNINQKSALKSAQNITNRK